MEELKKAVVDTIKHNMNDFEFLMSTEYDLDLYSDQYHNELKRYYRLTKEQVEQLFDKYIEEKKNVASKGSELDQRSSDGEPGKADVVHEVQD